MLRATIAVDDFTDEQIRRLRAEFASDGLIDRMPQASCRQVYRDCLCRSDVFIGWPAPQLIKGSGLKLLQIGSSGWEAYQGVGLEEEGVALCTARGVYSIGVAEHCIAMMMALVRRLPLHMADKANKRFERHPPYGEITGATACIVGMGEIGSLLARRCKGLEMKVVAVVRNAGNLPDDNIDKIYEVADIEAAFSEADHIFLTLSAGPENHHLVNEAVMSRIPSRGFLYNVSRGAVIDEEYLFKLLKDGRIAGAGIDVTGMEPPASDSPLWELGEQVLITGHSAGISVHFLERFYNLIIRNCRNFLNHRPLENRVL